MPSYIVDNRTKKFHNCIGVSPFTKHFGKYIMHTKKLSSLSQRIMFYLHEKQSLKYSFVGY